MTVVLECRQCGTANYGYPEFCKNCGARLRAKDIPKIDYHEPDIEFGPEINRSKNKKWICPNCGAPTPSIYPVCLECGQRLDRPAVYKYCPICGASNSDEKFNCTKCYCRLVKPDFSGATRPEDRIICSKCGSSNEGYMYFCSECGHFLLKPAPLKPPAEDITFCPYCGASNDKNAFICIQCGEQLEKPTVYRFCPQCGSRTEADDLLYCVNCGYHLEKTAVYRFCPLCGTANSGKKSICPECKQRLTVPDTSVRTSAGFCKVCPECRGTYSQLYSFCPECGQELEKPEYPETRVYRRTLFGITDVPPRRFRDLIDKLRRKKNGK